MAANGVSAAACKALSAGLISDTRKQGVPGPVACRALTVHSPGDTGFRFLTKQISGGSALASSWSPAVVLRNAQRCTRIWSCQVCWSVRITRSFPLQVGAMPAGLFGSNSRVSFGGPLGVSPPVSLTARAAGDGEADTAAVMEPGVEPRSKADQLVDGMTFAQLCDEFECTSSPAVEQTARLIVRDLLEGNRVLGIYALFVKYKDPLRSFTGRAVYKRSSWADGALQDTTVSIIRMSMLSTSVLKIEWILRGKPRLLPLGIDKVVQKVTSIYTLNQITGQIVEHVEEWDLSGSSPQAQVYFWTTRLAYTAVQAGKDAGLLLEGLKKILDKSEDSDTAVYYQDPSGDPRKFFVEDNFQSEFYQIGLFIALIYLAVQFLRLTL